MRTQPANAAMRHLASQGLKERFPFDDLSDALSLSLSPIFSPLEPFKRPVGNVKVEHLSCKKLARFIIYV